MAVALVDSWFEIQLRKRERERQDRLSWYWRKVINGTKILRVCQLVAELSDWWVVSFLGFLNRTEYIWAFEIS